MASQGSTRQDQITLTGVSAVGYHGVLESERQDGQVFLVDAELFLDLSEAAESDDLAQTVNYAHIAQLIHNRITGEAHQLIETLCARISDGLLEEFPLQAVTVTVHKPQAPITVPFASVSVTMHRERP